MSLHLLRELVSGERRVPAYIVRSRSAHSLRREDDW
jgi:hypothetical protein